MSEWAAWLSLALSASGAAPICFNTLRAAEVFSMLSAESLITSRGGLINKGYFILFYFFEIVSPRDDFEIVS